MTGRVLTQPELCELPPSVLLLLPLSLPPATSALLVPPPLVYRCSRILSSPLVPLLLSSKRSPSVPPIRVSCDAYASDSHNDGFFLFSFFFLFVDRKARTKASLLRARYDRAEGEEESVHFQSIRTYTRGISPRRPRPKKEENSRRSYETFAENADGKENDRGRMRQVREFRRRERFAKSGFPVAV